MNKRTAALLASWEEAKEQLNIWKDTERSLRARVIQAVFPSASIGTSHADTADGRKLVLQLTLSPKVDKELLTNAAAGLHKAGIDLTKLFDYSPKLVQAAYHTLPSEQRVLVDDVVTFVDDSPKLEIREASAQPRRRRGKP